MKYGEWAHLSSWSNNSNNKTKHMKQFSIHWTPSNEGQESWEMETSEGNPITASAYSLERTQRPKHWGRVWRTPWFEGMKWSQGWERQLVFIRISKGRGQHTGWELRSSEGPIRVFGRVLMWAWLWQAPQVQGKNHLKGLEGRVLAFTPGQVDAHSIHRTKVARNSWTLGRALQKGRVVWILP